VLHSFSPFGTILPGYIGIIGGVGHLRAREIPDILDISVQKDTLLAP